MSSPIVARIAPERNVPAIRADQTQDTLGLLPVLEFLGINPEIHSDVLLRYLNGERDSGPAKNLLPGQCGRDGAESWFLQSRWAAALGIDVGGDPDSIVKDLNARVRSVS